MTDRIKIEPGKRSGQPCVRGLRITVWDVLSWLAAGMTEQEILDDYPELEAGGFSRSLRLRRPHGQACRPVKLLFDENLSRKLVAQLSELYPGSTHVAEVNLLERRIAKSGILLRQAASLS